MAPLACQGLEESCACTVLASAATSRMHVAGISGQLDGACALHWLPPAFSDMGTGVSVCVGGKACPEGQAPTNPQATDSQE
jgi:hypothetical protein|mmetsp:Transcript_53018/g.87171  ORF Transcript_53018/g.87171 Transcript_53018/m.87171 type:complete len:81 (+) Transcript_53018:349-591(+)